MHPAEPARGCASITGCPTSRVRKAEAMLFHLRWLEANSGGYDLLRTIATEAALRMRMPVSLCGEMAGDPRVTPMATKITKSASVPNVVQF